MLKSCYFYPTLQTISNPGIRGLLGFEHRCAQFKSISLPLTTKPFQQMTIPSFKRK